MERRAFAAKTFESRVYIYSVLLASSAAASFNFLRIEMHGLVPGAGLAASSGFPCHRPLCAFVGIAQRLLIARVKTIGWRWKKIILPDKTALLGRAANSSIASVIPGLVRLRLPPRGQGNADQNFSCAEY